MCCSRTPWLQKYEHENKNILQSYRDSVKKTERRDFSDRRFWFVPNSNKWRIHIKRRSAANKMDGTGIPATHGVQHKIGRVSFLSCLVNPNLCRWSYAVLLYELFSLGDEPYISIQKTEILDFIRSGQRLPQPQFAPENMCVRQFFYRFQSRHCLHINYVLKIIQLRSDATMLAHGSQSTADIWENWRFLRKSNKWRFGSIRICRCRSE